MHTPRLSTLARAAAAVVVVCAAPVDAAQVIGLTTTNALLSFDTATPGNGSSLTSITGLQGANERILGIDARPTTGVVYGISSDSKVYSLSPGGQASFVGALSTALASTTVGIDFNPVADLSGAASLRIVGGTGQNYAFNVANGTTTVATDVQAGFAGVAYSNNDVDPATATSLYYLDATSDTLKVATANFNAPTITTVGSLGIDINGVTGFDIGGASNAFAALADANTGKSGLYSINLGSGAASFVGAFGIGGNTAIAPPLLGLTLVVAAVPEPQTWALLMAGLGGVGLLARRRAGTKAPGAWPTTR